MNGPVRNGLDLEVLIDLRAKRVDAMLLAESVRCIEAELHRSEVRDLEEIAGAFPELPAVALDAARQRLPLLRGHSFVLTGAKSGSLVLTTCLVGLAVWVLKETLGSTVKESWVESGMHARLKEFLMKRRDSKAARLRERIAAQLPRRLDKLGYGVSVDIAESWIGDEEQPRLQVIVSVLSPLSSLPTRAEVLDSRDRGTRDDHELIKLLQRLRRQGRE
jgi:hypothetical protein